MKRSIAFWIIVVLFSALAVMLVMGQTMAVVNYDFAVTLGLQETVQEISAMGVQTNRAIGVADTLVFLPLLVSSLIGLSLKKRWALLTSGASMALTAYLSIMSMAMVLFLRGTPGYEWQPGVGIWAGLVGFLIFGTWGFFHVLLRGDELLR